MNPQQKIIALLQETKMMTYAQILKRTNLPAQALDANMRTMLRDGRLVSHGTLGYCLAETQLYRDPYQENLI